MPFHGSTGFGYLITSPDYLVARSVIYKASLTGDNESPVLSDLELPVISSIQASLRSGSSYLGIVLPYFDEELLAELEARGNGSLVITRKLYDGDGEYIFNAPTISIPLQEVRYDRGSRSASLSVIGRGAATYSRDSAIEVTLAHLSGKYLSIDTSTSYLNYVMQSAFMAYLLPGDTVNHESDSGEISSLYINDQGRRRETRIKVTT